MEKTEQLNNIATSKKSLEDELKKHLTEIRKLKAIVSHNKEQNMKGNDILDSLGIELNELNREVSYMRHNDPEHKKGKTIDNLYEDPVIPTQKWCCISFLSPEGIRNCNYRAIKFRGVYETREEANKRAKFLQSIDPDFHIFVGECGKWLGWDPDPNSIDDQEYSDKKLQKLVSEYKKNRTKAKIMEEERKREIIEENVRREATKTSKQHDKMRKKLDKSSTDTKIKENDSKDSTICSTTGTTSLHENTLETKNTDKLNESLKIDRERLLKKEDEIKKTVENLSSVDDKINHLQKMYKEMLQKKMSKSSKSSYESSV